MADLLYELNRVCHLYGHKKVLDIDALKIPAGSILGLSGPNGSGKSTLLKLMAFAMAPTQGKILFNSRPEFPMSPRVRSRVTLLTQKPYLLKRSVFDNVIYGLKIRKDTQNLKQRVAQALAAVGLDFHEFHHRSWHQLSGGEAQRVAMAARLILRPKALLLDEPVASVDTESARLIRRASLDARDSWGCTLIIVSHDLIWLNQCSDTRISMEKGRIFSTLEESILPPPYEKRLGQDTLKDIGNNEYIRLSPQTGSTAVIPQKQIKLGLSKEEKNGYDNQVTAQIISMTLEQKTGDILTTLSVGNFSISLTLTRDQVLAQGLGPGKKIILMFRSKDIAWC